LEITVLDRTELALLWAIALLVPAGAHALAFSVGKRFNIPPAPAPRLRLILLTAASVSTLIALTATRFESVEIADQSVTFRYPPPLARACTVPRSTIENVALRESSFPNHSYSIAVLAADGREHRSVSVNPRRLEPLYEIFHAFRPGETPYVALR